MTDTQTYQDQLGWMFDETQNKDILEFICSLLQSLKMEHRTESYWEEGPITVKPREIESIGYNKAVTEQNNKITNLLEQLEGAA